MNGTNRTGVLAAAVLASVAVNAQAGDRWEVTVAPYVMGAAIEGDTVVMGQDAPVDVSAKDVFENMDFGFMGMAAARKGDWAVTADAVLVDLGVESQLPPADFQPTIGVFSLGGARRLTDFADVTAGVRWNHLKAVVDLRAPVPAHVEKTRNWVDPVVGVVLRTPRDRRVHGTLIADVGGFGVGSELSWQLFPTVGVQVSKRVSVEAGWRFLDVDYEKDDPADRFEYDVLYQGPVVGFTFRF
jgi:hypothetical protein